MRKYKYHNKHKKHRRYTLWSKIRYRLKRITKKLWKNDFIKATVLRFIQYMLMIASPLLGISSLMMFSASIIMGIVFIVSSILCCCAVFGIRYYLGSVIRIRK